MFFCKFSPPKIKLKEYSCLVLRRDGCYESITKKAVLPFEEGVF
jgi:hypothetical protein